MTTNEQVNKSSQVGISLRNVNIMIRRKMECSDAKKQFDCMTGTHGYVICYLMEKEGEDVFQRDVERRFSIRRSTATAILQLMERNGLIVRRAIEKDARLKKIELTDRAKALCGVFEGDLRKINEVITAGFSEQEIDQLLCFLERIISNLGGAGSREEQERNEVEDGE